METSKSYQPSIRIQKLRERGLKQPDELFLPMFRNYYYLEGWMSQQCESLTIRNVNGYCNVIENMPPLMVAGEIIVGESADRNWDGMMNFFGTDVVGYSTAISESQLSDEQKDRMIGWVKQEPFSHLRLFPLTTIHRGPAASRPRELELAEEHGVVTVWGTDLNHSIRAYEKVLRLSFSGLKAEVESALVNLSIVDPNAAAKRANLLAWKKICESAEKLGTRHAVKARELAASCDDPDQMREWEIIAEICDRVPAQPARTFREAVQSLHFAHILTIWEDGINANGIGRIDQFLWPYLEKDLADGTITWQEAGDILAALWIKLYKPYDVQQMMVGGQHSDGTDATNPLSYFVLEVTDKLDFIRCLSARLHKQSPRDFVAKCIDLVAKGGGIPFFFNDEALVPALVSRGVPIEDARGYAAIGCIEITIPGMASPHAVSHWINLAKVLELALNDGRDLLDETQVGPRTGSLTDYNSIDEVIAAYTKQLEYFAEWCVYGSNADEIAHRGQYRLPYLSLLTEDCVSRGMDIIEGGARYNYHSSAAMGIPNVADSLAALQMAVFNEKTISPAEMLQTLKSNFADSENLRLYLKNRLPKYGNDEPLPDGFASELARQYCDLLARYTTPSGGTFFCHLFTFTLMLGYGKMTAASPDGRLCGEPLAYSVSPVQGRDQEGITAALNSLAKIPHEIVAASSSAILEVTPSLFDGAGREAFISLIIAAIEQGVGQLQFNVVNAETLQKAQAEPDKYRNICVRVSGFSQQFCLLDCEMQNHIIARTKHAK